jgi:hypothetical protein
VIFRGVLYLFSPGRQDFSSKELVNGELNKNKTSSAVPAGVAFIFFRFCKQACNASKYKSPWLRQRLYFYLSGRQDSNLRPPGPKPGAITGLRYAPDSFGHRAAKVRVQRQLKKRSV